jgi:phosphotransferase system IIA component
VSGKLLHYPPETFQKRFDIPSPFSGQVTSIDELDDPMLKHGFFGPGAAVASTANSVIAPFSGTVLSVQPLDYAIDVKSSAGLKCRIKYGFDTLHLHGAQFNCAYKVGDKFDHKSPLFTLNSAWLKQQGVANICIMTVMNAQALLGVMATNRKYVEASEDPLLTLFV